MRGKFPRSADAYRLASATQRDVRTCAKWLAGLDIRGVAGVAIEEAAKRLGIKRKDMSNG